MTGTMLTPLPAPPGDHPDLPAGAHPWWAAIVPSQDTASQAVDHVSNVEFVRWLDQLGQGHLESLGWANDDLLAAGGMWFVARHEIDYRSEARAGETLLAATWARSVRRVKSWRDTIIWRDTGDGAEIVCTASTLWVYVDLNSRRPTRPPVDMVDALQPINCDQCPWRPRA